MNLEFEIKYLLPFTGIKTEIIGKAVKTGVNEHKDFYFDTNDYSLMLTDRWLRWRIEQTQSKYWLKYRHSELPLHTYLECDLPSDISNGLGMRPVAKSLEQLHDDLLLAKIRPQFQIDTIRETYYFDGLTICFDQTDFGYHMVEVEKIVPNFTDLGAVTAAENSIKRFAASVGLVETNLFRKPVEFLRRNKPDIFQKLEMNGIIKTRETIPT